VHRARKLLQLPELSSGQEHAGQREDGAAQEDDAAQVKGVGPPHLPRGRCLPGTGSRQAEAGRRDAHSTETDDRHGTALSKREHDRAGRLFGAYFFFFLVAFFFNYPPPSWHVFAPRFCSAC
jgi:hypothetical protein